MSDKIACQDVDTICISYCLRITFTEFVENFHHYRLRSRVYKTAPCKYFPVALLRISHDDVVVTFLLSSTVKIHICIVDFINAVKVFRSLYKMPYI